MNYYFIKKINEYKFYLHNKIEIWHLDSSSIVNCEYYLNVNFGMVLANFTNCNSEYFKYLIIFVATFSFAQ